MRERTIQASPTMANPSRMPTSSRPGAPRLAQDTPPSVRAIPAAYTKPQAVGSAYTHPTKTGASRATVL